MAPHDPRDASMTLTEHLDELRVRLLKSGAGWIAATLAAAVFSGDIFEYSVAPLVAVLEEKNRVDTVLVHPDPDSPLEVRLDGDDKVRFRARVDGLAAAAREVQSGRRPVDLVLVDARVLPEDGTLLTDLLENAQVAPEVAYLVPGIDDPRVRELQLQGAQVVLDPPKPAVLTRVIRRAAAAAGKTQGGKLSVMSVMEPFFAYLKIALVVGLFLSCPIWLYQAWCFVAPGLYQHERKFALPVVISGSLLFVAGGAFAYYGMFPVMFDFLVNAFMSESMTDTYRVSDYLSMLMMLTVAFGVVFELPLAIGLASAVGLVKASQLRQMRKYAWVLSFVLGALLTPADPISQMMMAVPLVVFYELGTVVAAIFERQRQPGETAMVHRDPPE